MTKVRWEIFVHLVWATRNREPLLHAGMRPRTHTLMYAKAIEAGCEILAIGGIEDHIHVLVSLAPASSIPVLVKSLKGSSSHFINQQFAPDPPFAWQAGYGAFSVSKANLARTIRYIENQEEHHAKGDTVNYYEW